MAIGKLDSGVMVTGGARVPYFTNNIGIKSDTTTNADDSITITGSDGTALSQQNPGWITVPGATAGQLATLSLEADVTIDLTGADWGFAEDLTDEKLIIYAINDAGTLKFGIGSNINATALTSILDTDDTATPSSVTSSEKVLVNTALTGDSACLEIGWVKSDFDLTGGAAEKLWTVQTALDDINLGEKGLRSVGNLTVRTKQAAYTLDTSDNVILAKGVDDFTLTLPAASGNIGLEYFFKRTDHQYAENQDFTDGDVTTGTDNINITGHGYYQTQKVQVSNSGGALPGGLSTSTDYWIIKVDDDNFKLASSVANADASSAVDITSASGGGTHTIEPQETTVTIDGNGSDTIDGNTTTTLMTENESLKIVCDGTGWQILNRNVVTQWYDFTPGSAGFGTVSYDHARWRRTASGLQYQCRMNAGTTVASEAQVNLPGNGRLTCLTGDSTNASCAQGSANAGNNASNGQPVALITDGDAFLNFGQQEGSNRLSPNNGNALLVSSSELSFGVVIPIKEWDN